MDYQYIYMYRKRFCLCKSYIPLLVHQRSSNRNILALPGHPQRRTLGAGTAWNSPAPPRGAGSLIYNIVIILYYIFCYILCFMQLFLGNRNFQCGTVFDETNTVGKPSSRAFQRYFSFRKRFHINKVMIA